MAGGEGCFLPGVVHGVGNSVGGFRESRSCLMLISRKLLFVEKEVEVSSYRFRRELVARYCQMDPENKSQRKE